MAQGLGFYHGTILRLYKDLEFFFGYVLQAFYDKGTMRFVLGWFQGSTNKHGPKIDEG